MSIPPVSESLRLPVETTKAVETGPDSATRDVAKRVERSSASWGRSSTQVDATQLQKATEVLTEIMEQFQIRISFSLDQDTERMVVRVTNSITGEVIRQIPPEEMLKVLARIDEVLGMIYDDHA